MKKILALVLALVLLLMTGVALAESSKGGDDNNGADVKPVGPGYIPVPGGPEFFIKITEEEDKIAWANAEIARMQAAENYQTYFEQANAIAAILDDPEYLVNEFWPIIAGNYKDEMGDIETVFYFATLYELDQDVAVEVGFEMGKDEEGNSIMEWKTFPGKGQEDGSIIVTFDGQTVKDVEAKSALMAIVSK